MSLIVSAICWSKGRSAARALVAVVAARTLRIWSASGLRQGLSVSSVVRERTQRLGHSVLGGCVRRREDHQPLQDVLELADVARPGSLAQDAHAALVSRASRP